MLVLLRRKTRMTVRFAARTWFCRVVLFGASVGVVVVVVVAVLDFRSARRLVKLQFSTRAVSVSNCTCSCSSVCSMWLLLLL